MDYTDNYEDDSIAFSPAGFFFPIKDEREYESLVDDVDGGECFFDYAHRFYEEYGDDIFDVDFDVLQYERDGDDDAVKDMDLLLNF